MDDFSYQYIIHGLNQLQWLNYELRHVCSVQVMSPLCLYLMLRLYYCTSLSFYDPQKLAYCNALCTIHFVKHMLDYDEYGEPLNLTYELTSTGRKFVEECVPHHFLMFCIEYTTVVVKKILYILLSLMFVIVVLNYRSVGTFIDVPANLVYITSFALCLIICATMMLLVLTDADPVLKGTQIEHVSKSKIIQFMNHYCKNNINYSKIIDVIEHSLFKKKNRYNV